MQTIPHWAYIFGLILALQAAKVVQIWCDCSAAVSVLATMISYLENDSCWIPNDHCDFWEIVVSLCLAWLKTDHPPFRSLKQRDMSILYPNWVVNHWKEFLIMLLMCRQRRQSNRTMLLFESICDLQSLHQKVVECQNKITQKTFQLLKNQREMRAMKGKLFYPKILVLKAFWHGTSPTQWICVTIPCTIRFLLLGFVNGLTPSNGK